MRIIVSLLNQLLRLVRYLYFKAQVRACRSTIDRKKQSLRGKNEPIRVLFILSCLAKWKTESLYVAMTRHPKFEPIIGISFTHTDFPSEIADKTTNLESYLRIKGYNYIELSLLNMSGGIKPDIVFYNEASTADDFVKAFPNALFCYVCYCFATAIEKSLLNSYYQNACWLYFVENKMLIDYAKSLMDNKAVNMIPTGLPMVDELTKDKSEFIDPWKEQACPKKRIIWAPHHTIEEGGGGLHFSTFMDIAEDMLEIAERYSDIIQFAFKPHPVLRTRLNIAWGKNKTDDYYNKWATLSNTQLEEGDYVGLFLHSDAMIHDSASFIVEYLYTNKPCMFLVNGRDHHLNKFAKMCYDQHYLGKSKGDVIQFITDIINDVDSRKKERLDFINENLLMHNGETACGNIINEILSHLSGDEHSKEDI